MPCRRHRATQSIIKTHTAGISTLWSRASLHVAGVHLISVSVVTIRVRKMERNTAARSGDLRGEGSPPSPRLDTFRKLSLVPLVFLIFSAVCGGPFGVEDSVKAGGPFLALIGFLIFPFVWSIPEAMITAEMGTMFPENGGSVVWVASALGPFWGFQVGWVKWLSGVIDNALYPVLFLDYLKSAIPALEGPFPRIVTVLVFTVSLAYMTYRGLTAVGRVAILLGLFTLLPFIFMGLVSIPKLIPARWLVMDLSNVDWGLYFNTLFWNLNGWDSVSTVTGEVENPRETLPKALFCAVILVVSGYFFPLLIGTGAVPLTRESWSDGYFSDVAELVGGEALRVWVQVAAALSTTVIFLAEMCGNSYQLLGMAEIGMLPSFFAKRSRHGTPLTGIIFSASGVLLLSWFSFQEIVAAENFLYCCGMLMEFVTFVKLRVTNPEASRPYKIRVGTTGAVLFCSTPCGLIFAVLGLASFKTVAFGVVGVVIGFVLYPWIESAKTKGRAGFSAASIGFQYQQIDDA